MKHSRPFAWGLVVGITMLAGEPSGILGYADNAVASVPQSVTVTAHACGREFWNVKTLTDPAAVRVNLTPILSTVEAHRAMPVPGVIEFGTPRLPQGNTHLTL